MGKFDHIIIISDIDGTFLGKCSRMVPENLEAIEYFKQEGGSFTLATGREYCYIHRPVPNVRELCNIPLIACNGAYIYDLQADRIALEEFLPEPEISEIVDAVRARFPDLAMRIAVGGRHLTDRAFPSLARSMERYPGCIEILPYDQTPHGRWHQITWNGTPEELSALRQVIDSKLRVRCSCAYG